MTFNATSSEPAKEHFTLSPSYIKQNGVLMIAKYWKKIDLTNNAAPTRIYEEEEKDPKINSMVWLDDNDNKRIEVEEFNETIRVFIKVSDIDLGEMLTIKLYAKSNRNFESLKYKEYQAEVVEALGNIYATCKISLDKQWKINKPNVNNNLIDTIYIKATYNTVSKDFSTNGLDIVTQKLKGIYLEKGKDKAYYYQGKLYTATQDKKGMIPYTEKPRRQFRETKEALDLIYTKPIGKNFIDDIFKRSNPNFITITRKGGKNNTFGKKVSWSPGDNFGGLDVNGNTKRKPFIALAHELWHAWENWLQINNSSIWIQKTEMNRLEKSIRYKELTTSQFENKIRTEHSFPKRKWYSYTINDGNNTKTGFGQIF